MRHVLPFGLLALCCVAAAIGSPEAGAEADEAIQLAVRRNPIVGQDPPAGADQPGAGVESNADGRSWWPYAALAAAGGAAALLCAMAVRRARA